jgi:Flp pilus assembly pilin Flp
MNEDPGTLPGEQHSHRKNLVVCCSRDNANEPVTLTAVGYRLAPIVNMLSPTQRSDAMESARFYATTRNGHQGVTTMTKAEMLIKKTRGATMVEYALLIIAIMVLAAVGYKNLGKQVKTNAEKSTTELQ